MGCCNAKEAPVAIQEKGHRGTVGQQKFVEQLFQTTGQPKKLADGDELIKQGAETESAYYIKEGSVSLLLTDDAGNKTTLATRGPGEVLGELSLLLGHEASVSAIAKGSVSVIEVQGTALLTMLREDPGQSGRLFKARSLQPPPPGPPAPGGSLGARSVPQCRSGPRRPAQPCHLLCCEAGGRDSRESTGTFSRRLKWR